MFALFERRGGGFFSVGAGAMNRERQVPILEVLRAPATSPPELQKVAETCDGRFLARRRLRCRRLAVDTSHWKRPVLFLEIHVVDVAGLGGDAPPDRPGFGTIGWEDARQVGHEMSSPEEVIARLFIRQPCNLARRWLLAVHRVGKQGGLSPGPMTKK